MQKENYEKAVSNYAEDIYRIAFSMVQAKEDAEDILQNVFMKLLMHQKEFHDSDHLRRWLIRVAINECNSLWTSSWRKRVELKEFSERDMAGNDSFYNSEYEDLYTAMRTLPPKLRIVIHLFYYEEYSTREIASLLHILEATVRTRLSRARKLLKIQLDNQTKERRAVNEQNKRL